MTQRGYDVKNEGKRIACPRCAEDRPEFLMDTHGGLIRCLACGIASDLAGYKREGARPPVLQ